VKEGRSAEAGTTKGAKGREKAWRSRKDVVEDVEVVEALKSWRTGRVENREWTLMDANGGKDFVEALK
jgi:hypothetical protein